MQGLESLTHRHEDGSLHSELASRSGGAVGRGVGVVTGGQGCSHCMVHIGDGLHDACCQRCYVQYSSHLQRAAASGPYDCIKDRSQVEDQNLCKQAHAQLFVRHFCGLILLVRWLSECKVIAAARSDLCAH